MKRSDRYQRAAARAKLRRARRLIRRVEPRAVTVGDMCRLGMARRLVALAIISGCMSDPVAAPNVAEAVSPAVAEACPDCKAEGLCTWTPERGCVAATDADCRQSLACWSEGKCVAEDGAYVASWASRVSSSLRAVLWEPW